MGKNLLAARLGSASEEIMEEKPTEKVALAPDRSEEFSPGTETLPAAMPEPKEKLPLRRAKRAEVPAYEENRFDEEYLEQAELQESMEEAAREKKAIRLRKAVTILFSLACIYLVMLIYGVAMTNYQYDASGTIAPQKLSISDIREKKAFETILVQYEKCRILYEDILLIDYRLGEGIEDPLVIAPDYEALLEDKKNHNNVSNLTTKTKAMEVDAKYNQLKELLYNWLYTDCGRYLGYMSRAITTNNADDASMAIQYKQIMYSDFSIITQNIVALGEQVPGVDLVNIKAWTPESFVENHINSEG